MRPVLWICQSRTRLLVASLMSCALLLAPAVAVATYIREASTSPFGDMIMQTAWLFLALPASYFTAVLIGDLIFPNRWRERVILGIEGAGDEAMADDDPMAAVRAIKRTRSFKMPFYMMLVLLVLGCAGAIELVTGGFLGEYQRLGYFRTLMRTDKTATKIALIDEQTDKRRESHVTTAIELITEVHQDADQPQAIRRQAIVTLGRLGNYLVQSVDSWNKKGSAEGHWELALLAWMHENTAPAIRRGFSDGDPVLRRAAAIALGKMRDSVAGPLLNGYLAAKENAKDDVYFGAAVGLGFLHDFEQMNDLIGAAEGTVEDIDAFRYVSWAVAQTSMRFQVYEHETGPPPQEFDRLIALYARVLKTGETAQRCVAAYVLNKTGHAGIIAHLMTAFDQPGSEGICSRHELDMDNQAPYVLGDDQPLRRAVLWAFSNVAKGNMEVSDWARQRSEDLKLSEDLRRNLESLSATARPPAE